MPISWKQFNASIDWDAANKRFDEWHESQLLIDPDYRKSWEDLQLAWQGVCPRCKQKLPAET